MKKETMWLLGGGALIAFLLLRKPGTSRLAANHMPYPEADRILSGTNQRVGAFRGSRNDTTGGVRRIGASADSPAGGYYIDDTGNSENFRLIGNGVVSPPTQYIPEMRRLS
jgi:hypothetical protein